MALRPGGRARPLVAVVCAVPLLGEAVAAALEFADVRTFAEGGGDVKGLLESLDPDAVVVDSETGAAAAEDFAQDHDLPALYVAMRELELRLLRDGTWVRVGDDGPTPEAVRNAVAGALFAGGRQQ